MGVEATGPLIRVGELARRAGVAPATLRAWERRYGIVAPRRGESGYRLYSEDDERRVRRMTGLIASGLAPAEAARRAGESRAEEPQPSALAAEGETDVVAGYREALGRALADFDEAAADRVLDRAIAVLSLDALLDDVVLPALRGLEGGTVGQEHFGSNLIRGRLLGLARGWGGGTGPLAVLACPAGELHDLGLIAFGLALRARGWRISFLGANTPIDALAAAVAELEPALVVLSALTPGALEGAEPEIAALGRRSPLRLAGAGASVELAERARVERLLSGPVRSAAELTV